MPGSKHVSSWLHKSQRLIYRKNFTPAVSLTLSVSQKSIVGFRMLFLLRVICVWRRVSRQKGDGLVHGEFLPACHHFSVLICLVLGHSWVPDLAVLLKCRQNTKGKQEHARSQRRIYSLYWLFSYAVSLHTCFWLLSDSMLGWVDVWTNLECSLRKQSLLSILPALYWLPWCPFPSLFLSAHDILPAVSSCSLGMYQQAQLLLRLRLIKVW